MEQLNSSNNKPYRLTYLIFILFILYGIFCWRLHPINPDDVWEMARAEYFKSNCHQGEPLLIPEISPFYCAPFNANDGRQLAYSCKSLLASSVMFLLPDSIGLRSLRIASFLWALGSVIATYFLTRKLCKNSAIAMLAAALLMVVPEFFAQIHTERVEIAFPLFYILGIFLLLAAHDEQKKKKRISLFFLVGLYAWIPAIILHPAAMFVAPSLGLIYLYLEKKNIFSKETIVISIGLFAGCAYLYYLIQVPIKYSLANGGGDFLKSQILPIQKYGLLQLIRLPILLYSRLVNISPVSKVVSLLWIIMGFASFIYVRIKLRETYSKISFLLIALITPFFVLNMFSSSMGHSNIVVFPFFSIPFALTLYHLHEQHVHTKHAYKYLPALVLVLFLFSNIFGIKLSLENNKKFESLTKELASLPLEKGKVIMGTSLYYLSFHDYPFIGNSWLDPNTGIITQHFDEAIEKTQTKYVILDDIFVYKAYHRRGSEWTAEMLNYIKSHGVLMKEIRTSYELPGWVLPLGNKIEGWKYPEFKKNVIGKIQVYELK